MHPLCDLYSKNIEFNDLKTGTEESCKSWVSTTLFLQKSLDQHDLSLCGNLSDRWDAVWRIHDLGNISFEQHGEHLQKDACLKHRMENSRQRADACLFSRLMMPGFWKPDISPTSYDDRLCEIIEKACISGDALWTFRRNRLQ